MEQNNNTVDMSQVNREALIEDIRNVNPFLDNLYREGELTREECDIVRSKTSRRMKACSLLDILDRKGPGAYGAFCAVLKRVCRPPLVRQDAFDFS
ncbi:Hypp1631 [Branchiostoma lanceolatum]|uniref:Hypp1631 protein n=1 Tax=Branchiostoma lanceolatum TaxID=7740 RepID=A0A8K0EP42_BRALA|nr:Hypp1631 [Branchiostoma lanceolatum]